MILASILIAVIPFLTAGMVKSIVDMKDDDKQTKMGPIPYCIAISILLVIILNLAVPTLYTING